jgi:hypothetical protein
MPEYIIDTNVLLIAQREGEQMSDSCVLACIDFIESIFSNKFTVVIDDHFEILKEYQLKLNNKGQKKYGDRLLHWIYANQGNPNLVKIVPITPVGNYDFEEFPTVLNSIAFDNSDKKFVAVSISNNNQAPIVQCSDSKWIGWEENLAGEGVQIHFLCRDELTIIYERKMG